MVTDKVPKGYKILKKNGATIAYKAKVPVLQWFDGKWTDLLVGPPDTRIYPEDQCFKDMLAAVTNGV